MPSQYAINVIVELPEGHFAAAKVLTQVEPIVEQLKATLANGGISAEVTEGPRTATTGARRKPGRKPKAAGGNNLSPVPHAAE